ncbi:hypothetical protein CDAR_300231 [Caerostris darwini]|uniref:Uncharacterized protein n=1 Tax=Caerostris darwini TaxID=1538125 RepID=A0AAV4V865_9ARAC|nr:hypothetical protein CDAR_300231 [Caerostris darwini]
MRHKKPLQFSGFAMNWKCVLCFLIIEVVCLAEAEPLFNETAANDTVVVEFRMFTDRLGNMMSRLYERSDRYDLASYLIRAVFEHFFAIFYSGV